MLPVVLAPAFIRAALVGAGPLAAKRLGILQAAGMAVTVFCPNDIGGALTEVTGGALKTALPSVDELKAFNLLLVAGLDAERSAILAGEARTLGLLVNVEDMTDLCDFHMPSIVRRGDLLFSISTGGRGPGLARLIRRRLEALFPEDWADRMTILGALRERLRRDGADARTINKTVERTVTENGWLP